MPAAGYIFMTLGVVLSLLVGFGLMGLIFYSSRQGYDEDGNDQRPLAPGYPPSRATAATKGPRRSALPASLQAC